MTHGPRRTCIGCRQVRPKRELVRLVRGDGGQVMVDPEGQSRGRGAYACPDEGCLTKALAGNRLSHAFKGASRPPAESAAVISDNFRHAADRRRR